MSFLMKNKQLKRSGIKNRNLFNQAHLLLFILHHPHLLTIKNEKANQQIFGGYITEESHTIAERIGNGREAIHSILPE
ncbi:hypothetical protein AAZX31_11G154700 [Glycine max]